MKTIILTTAMLLGTMVSNAQNLVTDWSNLNVLYLGFENRVKIDANPNEGESYTLSGSNCIIGTTDNPNVYILKVGRGATALLTMNSVNKEGQITALEKKQVEIKTLPQPTIYWGNVAAGEEASLTETKLRIGYPSDPQLKANFQIVRWSLTSNYGSANGPGSDLTAATSVFNKITSNTEISILLDVKGDDGITRRIGASWTVSPLKGTE